MKKYSESRGRRKHTMKRLEDNYEDDYEDSYVSNQDYSHNREKEKYSESRGRRKYVQQSGTNHWFDNILAIRFNKIKYDIKSIQRSQAVQDEVIQVKNSNLT